MIRRVMGGRTQVKLLALGLIHFAFFSTSLADELSPLYRGLRQHGMGGAYVAIADDEQALWLNPAGLSRGTEDAEFHYANVMVETSNDLIFGYTNVLGAFTDFSITSINALMGTNTYGRAQFSPTLLLGNYGFGILVDGQSALFAKNQALPEITVGYQTTTGVIAAGSFSLMHGFSRRRVRKNSADLRVGLGLKVLWRRGGYREMDPIDLLALSQSGTGRSLLSQIAGSFGMGYGFDTGILYRQPLSRVLTVSAGAAITDIGDTSFSSEADQVPQNFTFGLASEINVSGADFTLAFDYSNAFDEVDWRKKIHIGLELSIPLIDVYFGLNQVYITYGAAIDLGIFRLGVISYATELGTLIRQDPDRRYSLSLDFKFSL